MNYLNMQSGIRALIFWLLLGVPFVACRAVGFGEMQVHSYLNQPFDATIELFNAEDARNLAVQLAGPTRYTELDVSPPDNLSDFSATLQRVDGQSVVQLSTRQPVTELVIDIVLLLTADDSQQVRHYPVLIDFAPQLDAAVRQQRASPEPAEQRDAPPPARQGQARAIQAVRSGKSYGPIQRGQTLSGIVSDLSGDLPINGYQMMLAIVALNPGAFIDGNMNRMRAGAVLEIPQMDGFVDARGAQRPADRSAPAPRVNAPQPQLTQEAEARVPDSASRRTPTKADPRLELVGTPTSGQILTSLNQWLENDDTELGLRTQEARRDLSYAAAEIETYRKENLLLRDRVGELEERLTSLRRLVALKAAEEADSPAADALLGAAPSATDSGVPVAPQAQQDNVADGAESEAASGLAVESELAATAAVEIARNDEPGPRWWPWALAVLALLGVTLVVWYRGQIEDKARAQRTADLVHRIQSAGEQNLR